MSLPTVSATRVLIYQGGLPRPGEFGRAAIAALGQSNFIDGGMGAGPAQLHWPTGAALVRDGMGLAIVVADEQNNRVQVFRPL
ncbi:MAG: hypothetical protein RMK29_16390 [Myxococcales bacterium]|nr:hypothetical protein [Myxococcota bacterium]MDW8283292.1 hypothetical protein [Myxococcales bacterium]